MVEVGLCDPYAGPDEVARVVQPSEFAADEIRAALAWTRNAAYREHHFAETLLTRLPAVFTALDSGVICRSKVWLFIELCAELTDEQAQVVCQRLLPDAGRLATGELAARIKKLAIALDPEWAARWYASAVWDRDVIGYLDEDGTATVTGRKLPTDQAAAACARIEDLAKAAKRAGYPGRIGPLRADIYVGLLEGRWQHLTRDQIITDLLAHATPPEDTPQGRTPDVASGDISLVEAPIATDNTDGTVQPAAGERVGVELRVGLSTLLGRDRHPGEIPGWGPVTAETARTIVAAQRTGEWRYAITDPEGPITRRRPRSPPAKHRHHSGVGSWSCTSPLPCSPSWPRTPMPAANGPWLLPISPLSTSPTAPRARRRTRLPASPGQCYAVTSRFVIGSACTPAAVARPATPTLTTPSTTVTAALPPSSTLALCVGMIIA